MAVVGRPGEQVGGVGDAVAGGIAYHHDPASAPPELRRLAWHVHVADAAAAVADALAAGLVLDATPVYAAAADVLAGRDPEEIAIRARSACLEPA